MKGSLQPPRLVFTAWIGGAQEPVTFSAASWGDAITQLHDQCGHDPEFVLTSESASVRWI
jgi:hypothetical protein